MIRKPRPIVVVIAILGAVVVLLFGRSTIELIRGLRGSAALAAVGPADVPLVPRLVAQLGDSNPMIRQAAAEALGRIGTAAASARPALLLCLKSDPFSQVRSSAASSLGWLGPAPEVIAPLVAALEDDDPEVRRYAAHSLSLLAQLAGPAIPKLIDRLDDPHMGYMAARALGAIGPAARRSIPRLISALRRDQSLARMEFASALGRFGASANDAIPVLRSLAHDPDANVKKAAVVAMLRIQPVFWMP
jgi:HEAT repeat protein